MIRRFFRWLWALTPWGKPTPALPEQADDSPRLFHIAAEADWPHCDVVGSLCLVAGNEDWLGGFYMLTEEMGWVQMDPGEHHDST
jgi:hypothetical protein